MTPTIAEIQELALARPTEAVWRHNLGVLYMADGRWTEAIAAFEGCFALDPGHVEGRIHYPTALLEAGMIEQAAAEARRSLGLSRNSPQLHRTLGRALAKLGRQDEAITAFQESLRLDPDNPRTLDAAFTFFFESGEESRAAECGAKLPLIFPDQSAAWLRSAHACMLTGELETALAAYRETLRLDPASANTHSVLLYAQLMDERETSHSLLAAHRDWAARHCPPVDRNRPFPNSPDPDRHLRVGILSGEFSAGSGNFFLPPILRHRDHAEFELFAYSASPTPGESNPYRSFFDHWHEVARLTDDDIESAIRRDAIDILVDLSGHLPARRLAVFGRKPAPVQIAYPRYPCTTGLDAMDYRLTDEWTDPTGKSEGHYCEQLIRLPGGYLAYEPPEFAPPIAPLPALENGCITFGFFQTPLKLNPGVLDVVAAILVRCPNSRLLFHYGVHDFDRPGRHARERIVQALAERGVDSGRLAFCGMLALPQHLELLAQVDIALDSFPYSGQTTTCECLWMGVPVVTLAGHRHASRVSTSILRRAELDCWVAECPEGYVDLAVKQSSAIASLAELRRTLRARFAESPVLDAHRVAREVGQAYREAWRAWCKDK
jgi:predicted O-linked N-acetylglucosamine transferase (SPINDLY family)